MTVREATLHEVLDNREQRVLRQKQLLGDYGATLICFTMNIPGPIKYDPWVRAGFDLGKMRLLDILSAAKIPLLHQETIYAVTGCEGFFVVDAPAEQIKKLTVQLEDGEELGRLYDLDVLTAAGDKCSRTQMGLPGRKCLLCDKPASVCGPIRAHSAGQLWQRTAQLLREGVIRSRGEHIGAMASKALLYEVGITPKPGLVDRDNTGAHRDMDIFTFFASTAVLQPYFIQCAKIGMETCDLPPKETFRRIRIAGILAEGEMFRQTGGINTHKGAIFSLGIACAAAGRMGGQCPLAPDQLLDQCAAIAEGITREDLQGVTPASARTAGEKLFVDHGITGIRGQAEAGFPAVRFHGLPVLREGLRMGLEIDRAAAAALLAILANSDDTNLIHRSDRQSQQQVAASVAQLLAETPYPTVDVLRQLDRAFIRDNLSPGGSADLLALTLLVHFLSHEKTE